MQDHEQGPESGRWVDGWKMCKGAARKLDAASETKHLMEAEYEIADLSVP